MRRDRTQPRNTTKGRVRFETRGDRRIVTKDYSGVGNPFMRIYGAWSLRNEARAYARLAGVPGFPACFGINEQGCLEMEFVPGKPLGLFRRRSLPADIFEKFEDLLQVMHRLGVANTDLHRSNLLVSDEGDVYIIDFAHALIARDPRRPGLLVRMAMHLDRYAFARIKARFAGLKKPKPEGAFGTLYLVLKSLKGIVRRIKRSAA